MITETVWRSAMPAPGLPSGGLRTWQGGATRSPVSTLETAPNAMLHALQRMTFGPTPEDVARTAGMSLEDFIMEQTIPHILNDSACDAIISGLGHETAGLPLSALWNYRNETYSRRWIPFDEVEEETLIRMVHSRRQLFEVMIDFWHSHFNVQGTRHPIYTVWRGYDRDVIRAHAMGNFRRFIQAVGMHTAMLYYLDNVNSTDGGPNENYARELFELHTLGAEHYLIEGGYIDDDVFEAARCFTGWSVNNSTSTGNTGEFLYREENHDRFQKIVLGNAIARDLPPLWDGSLVYDILANHPMTHRHIALKLCRRFIADNPPASIVDRVANTFGAHRDHDWQITITIQDLLRSPEFLDSWHGKVRRPLDHLMAAVRAMGGSFRWDSDWEWQTQPLNHALFSWPTPDGYPDDAESWISTSGMLYRWNVISDIAVGDNDAVTVDLLGQTPAWAETPRQLVDFWIDRLLHRALAQHVHQALLDFVSEGRNPDLRLPLEVRDGKIPSLVALICSSPEFINR